MGRYKFNPTCYKSFWLNLFIILFFSINAYAQDCTKGQTVTFAQLPTTVISGTACKVTDVGNAGAITSCNAVGTVITSGSGSSTCILTWNGSAWIIATQTPWTNLNVTPTTILNNGNPSTDLVNSAALTTIGTVTSASILPNANSCVEISIGASLLYNNSTADTLTFTVVYGGNTAITIRGAGAALSASLHPIWVDGYMCNLNSSSAQEATATMFWGGAGAFNSVGSTTVVNAANGATIATNSAVSQTLTISAQFSAAVNTDELKVYTMLVRPVS